MKKGTLFLILIVLAAGVGFWIQQMYKPQQAEIPDPLIVGTSADYRPLEFKDNNTIVGFDIDLISEIAQRLGVEYTIRDMPFDFLLVQLQSNTVHVVAAGMSETPERGEHVYFSEPYLVNDPLLVITPAEKQTEIVRFEDLFSRNVAVNQGYTAEQYMQHFEDKINIIRLPSVAEAIAALNVGRADAFITAQHTIQPILDEHKSKQWHMFALEDTTETISLAISKQYPKLKHEIDAIIKQLKEENVIKRLKEKWNIA